MELNPCIELCVSCFYLTYCMEFVRKSSLGIGLFQKATQRPRILLTDNRQSGAATVSTITSIIASLFP